jgi:hypothetical protein
MSEPDRARVFGYGRAMDRPAKLLFDELEHAASCRGGWESLSEADRDIYRHKFSEQRALKCELFLPHW